MTDLVAVANALIVDRPIPGMELTFRLVKLPCKATAATASSDTLVQPSKDSTCTASTAQHCCCSNGCMHKLCYASLLNCVRSALSILHVWTRCLHYSLQAQVSPGVINDAKPQLPCQHAPSGPLSLQHIHVSVQLCTAAQVASHTPGVPCSSQTGQQRRHL